MWPVKLIYILEIHLILCVMQSAELLVLQVYDVHTQEKRNLVI